MVKSGFFFFDKEGIHERKIVRFMLFSPFLRLYKIIVTIVIIIWIIFPKTSF